MGKYLFGAAGPAAPYGTASLLEVLPFEQGAPGRYGVSTLGTRILVSWLAGRTFGAGSWRMNWANGICRT